MSRTPTASAAHQPSLRVLVVLLAVLIGCIPTFTAAQCYSSYAYLQWIMNTNAGGYYSTASQQTYYNSGIVTALGVHIYPNEELPYSITRKYYNSPSIITQGTTYVINNQFGSNDKTLLTVTGSSVYDIVRQDLWYDASRNVRDYVEG